MNLKPTFDKREILILCIMLFLLLSATLFSCGPAEQPIDKLQPPVILHSQNPDVVIDNTGKKHQLLQSEKTQYRTQFKSPGDTLISSKSDL